MVALLETKVASTTNNRTFNLLSQTLPMHIFIPGTGHAGGLWVCWDPQSINAELVHQSDQHVTLSRSFSADNSSTGLLTVIYASPNWVHRRRLWDSLFHFHMDRDLDHNSTPWILMGDFNCITDPQDKRGGSPFSYTPAVRDFQSFINNTNLTDLGFIGQPYTWCNMRDGPARILERIDRGLASGA